MWFVVIEGKTQGPYSFLELRALSRLSPDHFVWKEGFDQWKKIRDVPELKDLFVENAPTPASEEELPPPNNIDEEIVLGGSQPPFFIWGIMIVFLILYMLLQIIWKS